MDQELARRGPVDNLERPLVKNGYKSKGKKEGRGRYDREGKNWTEEKGGEGVKVSQRQK